jgi:hypothetical protein
MKRIPIFLLALSLLAGITGCQMFNGDEKENSSLRADAELITYLSSALYLQSNPQDRAKFEMARAILDMTVMNEELTFEELNAALSQLPIGELRSGNGAILFNTGLLMIQRFGGGGINQVLPEQTRAVAIGIRDGLSRSLGPPAIPVAQ